MAIRDCTPAPAVELAEAAELLLPRIAPRDLANVPVYVGLTSNFSGAADAGQSWLGYTSPLLSRAMQHGLSDRWRGPGLAMLLNDEAFPREFGDGAPAAFLGAVVHEAAHAVQLLPRAVDEPEMSGDAQSAFLAFADNALTESIKTADAGNRYEVLLYYDSHNPLTWLRLALHLHWRAGQAGVRVPLSRLGVPHYLSSPIGYAFLLGDECERLRDATMSEILGAPEPERYAMQALEDFQAFRATFLPSSPALPETRP